MSSGMSSSSDLISVKMRSGYFWSSVVEAIRLDSVAGLQEFVVDPMQVIISTNLNISLVPNVISQDFFGRLLSAVEYKVIQGLLVINCNTVLPSLSFGIDGKWIIISSSDIVIDVSAKKDRSLCIVSFMSNSQDWWYLG